MDSVKQSDLQSLGVEDVSTDVYADARIYVSRRALNLADEVLLYEALGLF